MPSEDDLCPRGRETKFHSQILFLEFKIQTLKDVLKAMIGEEIKKAKV